MPGYRVLTPVRKPSECSSYSPLYSSQDYSDSQRASYQAPFQQTQPAQQWSGAGASSSHQQMPITSEPSSYKIAAGGRAPARGELVVPYFRQKAGACAPPADAAGLLGGARFHGRTNPTLGPGIPPQDDYTPLDHREHHKGWHPQHSHLLQKRDIIGQAGYRGVPADNNKPSKKVFSGPIAEQQHLRGGAVGITAESAPERKARGWGLRPPYTTYNTASRTILAHTAQAAVDGNSSPRKPFARKVDMPRPGDHADVLKYRYSNGLCPDTYQLDSRRTPAPQVSLKTQDALSNSYYNARHECNVNRARAEGDTEVHFYHEMFMPRPSTAPQWV